MKTIYNRAGLSRISYRIGKYRDFRSFLLERLNQNQVLNQFTYRSADDTAIAMLEASATLSDILTFYQELYANEAYIATAAWPEDVQDLARLTGYLPAPGAGASTSFAFFVKGTAPVDIQAGFPLKAQLDDGNPPADFEASAALTAIPQLNKLELYRAVKDSFDGTTSPKSLLIKKSELPAGVDFAPNDQLIIQKTAGDPSSNALVTITSVANTADAYFVAISPGKSDFAVDEQPTALAWKVTKAYPYFGFNAPPYFFTADPDLQKNSVALSSAPSASTGPKGTLEYTWYYRNPLAPATNPYLDNSIDSSPTTDGHIDFPIPGTVADLSTNSLFMGFTLIDISAAKPGPSDLPPSLVPDKVYMGAVTGLQRTSLQWGPTTGTATIMSLLLGDEIMLPVSQSKPSSGIDVRSTWLYVPSAQFTVRNGEVADPTSGDLEYFGDPALWKNLLPRDTVFKSADGSTTQTVQLTRSSAAAEADGTRLLLTPKPNLQGALAGAASNPLSTASIKPNIIYGNVVQATQGKTVPTAILGSGNDQVNFQTFKLPKAPLTYLPDDKNDAKPELHVYVDGIEWSHADSLVLALPTDTSYIVRQDFSGNSWVQFGNGLTGRRVPTGNGNITVSFRTGVGASGELAQGAKVQTGRSLQTIDHVELVAQVSGGKPPETADHIRTAAPKCAQTLDRCVSLTDYEAYALQQVPDLLKCAARWTSVFPNCMGVQILYIPSVSGTPAESDVAKALLQVDTRQGPARIPITAKQATIYPIKLRLKVLMEPGTTDKPALTDLIYAALGAVDPTAALDPTTDGIFGLKNRTFGQPEFSCRIIGVVQNVSGVLAVPLLEMYDSISGFLPLTPHPVVKDGMILCPADGILTVYSNSSSIDLDLEAT